MDNLQTLQTILQLGWPAIVLIECAILWRDNVALRTKLVSVLENKETDTRQSTPPTIHSGQD